MGTTGPQQATSPGAARGGDRPPLRSSALAYFALALGWSTTFWLASTRWGPAGDPAGSPLFLVGGAGPLLAAVALTHLREPPATRRDFWLRVVDVRRLRGPWWAIALLAHPAIVACAFAAELALGGAAPALAPEARALPALLALVFFVFWFGPLPEEIGWRGFALDRLQARMGSLPASLVLGSVWALWHVPLFFVPGSYQEGLGLGSMRSWIFLASMVPLSVVMTWVYDHTSRSTLSAVLVHATGNLTGALFHKSERVAGLELGFLVVAAVLVTTLPAARGASARSARGASARSARAGGGEGA